MITHTGLLLIIHTDNPSCPVYTLCLPVFPKQNFKDVSASKDFLPILRHVHTATFCVRARPGQVRQTYLSLPISCHAWTWCLAATSSCFCMMMYYVCLLGLCHQVRWSVTYCLSPSCNSCFKVFQKCIARRRSRSRSWRALLERHPGPVVPYLLVSPRMHASQPEPTNIVDCFYPQRVRHHIFSFMFGTVSCVLRD